MFDFEAPAADSRARVYAVSELTRRIRSALEDLGRIAVEGEVSSLKRHVSGHLYFDLKDLDARLSCVVWRSQVASAVRFDLREGLQVVAHGRLDVYAPRGSYSLVVQRVEPAGIGAMLARLEELKQELKARGWFDRKRPVPAMPRRIGVVTSRDGAALQDFLRTRSLRWPLYPVLLVHTSVQGPGAAAQIADAIRRADACEVDVIVLVRGGGSLEDLWAFNELAVAEAIWSTRAPVVTGVGHETDVTLVDFVADLRAHTPTDAAQKVIPDKAERLRALERAWNGLLRAADGALGSRQERVERLARARVLAGPGWILGDRERGLVGLGRRLVSGGARPLEGMEKRCAELDRRLALRSPAREVAARAERLRAAGASLPLVGARAFERAEQRLSLAGARLEAFSHGRILARGYSITQRPDGAIVRDAAGVRRGDVLVTRLERGRLTSEVRASEPA